MKTYSYDMPQGGGAKSNEKTVVYLVDSYNHTGYAQVLEQWSDGGATLAVTYTIGDDIITEKPASPMRKHLLYDGHGSVRQAILHNGSINEAYSYDAYGVMLGGNPTPSNPAATRLLYAGEYFDTDLQQYYLRARYYDQNTGRFNRMDPFAGDNQDPQSLHKYLYCHANPINGIDPSGNMFGIGTLVTIVNVAGITMTALSFAVKGIQIGMGFKQLHALGDFMIELSRAPIPDLITKLEIRNVVVALAIDTIAKTFSLGLEIVRDGIIILAFSILLRATIGFLRSMKHARQLAVAAKAQGPITDPSRLLPAPKMHKGHILPKEKCFEEYWRRARIDINKYTIQIEQTTHLRGMHGRGMGKMPGRWNPRWKGFFRKHPDASALQIYQEAGKMMDEFGLSDYEIRHFKDW